MTQQLESEVIQTRLQAVNDALQTGVFARVRKLLHQLTASDIADLIESAPPKARSLLWRLVEEDDKGEIFEHLN